LTTLDNGKTGIIGRVTFANSSVALSFMALMGLLLGAFILRAGGLSYKWTFVIAAAGCFPLFVIAMGSLKRALEFCLILSLSMNVNVYPWFSNRYQELVFGVPFTLTSIILLGLYGLWLVRLYSEKGNIHFFPTVSIPYGLLVIWAGLSFLWATKVHLVASAFPLVLQGFLLFFYTANLIESQRDVLFVIKCMAVAGAFSGILGIYQYFAGTSFGLEFLGGVPNQLQVEYAGGTVSRVSGLLCHPNTLAFFLNGSLPVLLAGSLAFKGLRLRVLCVVSFALALVTLILTFSRAGWGSFFFSLALMMFFFLRKQVRKNYRGAFVRFVCLALAMAILVVPFFPKVMARLTKDDYGAAYVRIPLARTAQRIISQQPLTGVGLGNYAYVVPNYESPIWLDELGRAPPVHNIYLHTAAELGIPALFIFVCVLGIFFIAGVVVVGSANRTITLLAIGMIAGLAGCCLHGMVEPGTLNHTKFIPFWLIGGLLLGLKPLSRHKTANNSGGQQQR
jgi:hypothetical protein